MRHAVASQVLEKTKPELLQEIRGAMQVHHACITARSRLICNLQESGLHLPSVFIVYSRPEMTSERLLFRFLILLALELQQYSIAVKLDLLEKVCCSIRMGDLLN